MCRISGSLLRYVKIHSTIKLLSVHHSVVNRKVSFSFNQTYKIAAPIQYNPIQSNTIQYNPIQSINYPPVVPTLSVPTNLEGKIRLVSGLESRSPLSSASFDGDTHSIQPFRPPMPPTALSRAAARSTRIEDLLQDSCACSIRSRPIGWSVSEIPLHCRQTPSRSTSDGILASILPM